MGMAATRRLDTRAAGIALEDHLTDVVAMHGDGPVLSAATVTPRNALDAFADFCTAGIVARHGDAVANDERFEPQARDTSKLAAGTVAQVSQGRRAPANDATMAVPA